MDESGALILKAQEPLRESEENEIILEGTQNEPHIAEVQPSSRGGLLFFITFDAETWTYKPRSADDLKSLTKKDLIYLARSDRTFSKKMNLGN